MRTMKVIVSITVSPPGPGTVNVSVPNAYAQSALMTSISVGSTSNVDPGGSGGLDSNIAFNACRPRTGGRFGIDTIASSWRVFAYNSESSVRYAVSTRAARSVRAVAISSLSNSAVSIFLQNGVIS